MTTIAEFNERIPTKYSFDRPAEECEIAKAIEEAGEPAREKILDEATRIIYGDRQKTYGSARENMGRIAKIWSVALGMEVTEDQVINCMIGVKLARLVNTPGHRDSYVDIAGYVGVFDKMSRNE